MTLQEAIDRVDGLKPNQYSVDDKVRWLSELDMRIYRDIIMTHEHEPFKKEFQGYTENDLDCKMLVEEPYTEVYLAYLSMKIDEWNNETARYNNSATMFNAYLEDYSKWINKTRRPIPNGFFKLW